MAEHRIVVGNVVFVKREPWKALREMARCHSAFAVDALRRGDTEEWSRQKASAMGFDAEANAQETAARDESRRMIRAIDGILEVARRRRTAEALTQLLSESNGASR